MIKSIRKNYIFFCDERRDGSEIGGEAGLKRDDIFRAFEFCETLFEFNVQIGCARNRPHRGGTHTIFFRGVLGGFHELRMVRQSKIIVGAKIQNIFAIHDQACTLRRANRADAVIQALIF